MKDAAGMVRGVGNRKKHPTPYDRHGFKLLKVQGWEEGKREGW